MASEGDGQRMGDALTGSARRLRGELLLPNDHGYDGRLAVLITLVWCGELDAGERVGFVADELDDEHTMSWEGASFLNRSDCAEFCAAPYPEGEK
jgi:hypothetical protein